MHLCQYFPVLLGQLRQGPVDTERADASALKPTADGGSLVLQHELLKQRRKFLFTSVCFVPVGKKSKNKYLGTYRYGCFLEGRGDIVLAEENQC
jgi:hypothetical protein